MNVFELFGTVALKGQDKVQAELNKTNKVAQNLQKGLKVAGAAFTAVGVAGLAMIQSTKKMNADLAMVGVNVGKTGTEMRALALDVTNVTFPLDSVVATFDLLSRAGIKNSEEMKKVATDFDLLADAVGSTAEVVGETMVMGMKTFGEEVKDSGKHLDNVTFLVKNTTLSMEDLNSILGYTTQEAVEMGLTFDDTVAIMGVLESKGVTGSVATRAWRSALSESEKTGKSMNEVLGVTNEEMAEFNKKIAEAEGITQDYADMAAEQYTIMDKVKQKWSELTLKASGFLEPLEPVLAGMTAMGPVMMFFGSSMGTAALKTGLHTVAMIAHKVAMLASAVAIKAVTVAQWLWNAAMSANPIGLIIIAIVALIAAIVLIVQNWDWVKEQALALWKNIKEVWENIRNIVVNACGDMWERIRDVWNNIGRFFRNVLDNIVDFFKEHWDKILAVLFPAVGLPILIARNWGEIVDAVKDIWSRMMDVFANVWETAKQWGINLVEGLWEGIESLSSWIWDKVSDWAGDIFDSIRDGLGDLWPFSPSKAGVDIGKGLTEGIRVGVERAIYSIRAAMQSIETEITLRSDLQHPIGVAHEGYPTFGEPGGKIASVGGDFNIYISQLIVREKADIYRIARELYLLQQDRYAAKGIM